MPLFVCQPLKSGLGVSIFPFFKKQQHDFSLLLFLTSLKHFNILGASVALILTGFVKVESDLFNAECHLFNG